MQNPLLEVRGILALLSADSEILRKILDQLRKEDAPVRNLDYILMRIHTMGEVKGSSDRGFPEQEEGTDGKRS